MEYVMIMVLMISVCHKIGAKLSVIPRDTEVKMSYSTYMNCSTSLHANLVQWRHDKNYVYTGIAILEPYNDGRFSVEINASTGASNLVIRSVRPSDAGQYECLEDEGSGEKRSAELIVLDADPTCKSNMQLGVYEVIGPNSCGIVPDEVKLSCSVTYHGSIQPILRWEVYKDDQFSLIDGLYNITSGNQEVTYTLTLKSALALSNSSFICRTTRTSDKSYSCTSNVVNILYVFSSVVTVNMTVDEEVSCFANTSQTCSYKWKWFSGDDSTTESENQILKPRKAGHHRCEATCFIRNQPCTVESMYAMVYSDAVASLQNRYPLLAVILLPALAVIGVLIYRWRRKRTDQTPEARAAQRRAQLEQEKNRLNGKKQKLEQQQERLKKIFNEQSRKLEEEKKEVQRRLEEIEEQKRQQESRGGLLEMYNLGAVSIQVIRKQKKICGLAILDEKLFVVSEKSSDVEVYDTLHLSASDLWHLKELINPRDIGSCSNKKCLYIFDYKTADGDSKEILRVRSNGTLIKKWSTGDDNGDSLSVTYESNVILTVFEKNKLNVYSPDGKLIREISLSSDEGIRHPLHAMKLTNGDFVVSHGYYDDDLHRVCKLDENGTLKASFGDKPGFTTGQMKCPFHLSVDGKGFVLVTDRDNSRVLLLDSDLKFKREIVLREEEHALRVPWRILLDESNNRLLVSDNERNKERILSFDLKDIFDIRVLQ